MNPRLLLPLLLLVAACSKRADEASTLWAEARQRLQARDARLTSYTLESAMLEGEQSVTFRFAWRSPQRMLGVVEPPTSRTLAWDGEHLFEQSDPEKRFTTFRNELSAAKRAGFLTETFAPFSPEGFRAPLLPSSGVEARRVSHARAPEALELTVRPAGNAEGSPEVTYVLRWPSMDFLGKRLREGGSSSEVRVEEEHCDKALALCVPKRLTQWVDGTQVGETDVLHVEFNPTLPAESFTLVAPQGYTTETRTLVDAAPQAAPQAPRP